MRVSCYGNMIEQEIAIVYQTCDSMLLSKLTEPSACAFAFPFTFAFVLKISIVFHHALITNE